MDELVYIPLRHCLNYVPRAIHLGMLLPGVEPCCCGRPRLYQGVCCSGACMDSIAVVSRCLTSDYSNKASTQIPCIQHFQTTVFGITCSKAARRLSIRMCTAGGLCVASAVAGLLLLRLLLSVDKSDLLHPPSFPLLLLLKVTAVAYS